MASKGRKPKYQSDILVPNVSGRKTESSYAWYQNYYNDNSYLPDIIPLDLYLKLEELARYDESISKIKTDFVNATLSGLDIKCENTKFKEEIENFLNKEINKNNGGIHGLIMRWAGQAFIYGAICGEIIISNDLKTIEDVVLFDVKSVRYVIKDGKKILCQARYNDTKLAILPTFTCFHDLTYAENDSCYSTPSLASVIPAVDFKNIVEKGTLNQVQHWGFNTVVGKLDKSKFKQRWDEEDKDYDNRVQASLNKLQETFSEKKGGQPILTTNEVELDVMEGVKNAQDIASINSIAYSKLANALKVDKMMLNQGDFNTDVYNTVPYENFLKQVEQAQRVITTAINKIVNIYMLLNGVNEDIEIKFVENEVNDKFKEAQADQMKTRATVLRWQNGFIDSNQAARECGYDKAALELKPWELETDSRIGNGDAGGGNGNAK